MFIFDSLPEELSLLERREVKRLVMASLENTSKAAQALRVAILSGELSAVETLAKARALDGAKDAESVQPAEMPDWKKPIALKVADDRRMITLAGGFEADFIARLSAKAKRLQGDTSLSEKESPQLSRIWSKYPEAHGIQISDSGEVDNSARNAEIAAIFDERMAQMTEGLPKNRELMEKDGATPGAIAEFDETILEALQKDKVIADPRINTRDDVIGLFRSAVVAAGNNLMETMQRHVSDVANKAIAKFTPELLLSAIQGKSLHGDDITVSLGDDSLSFSAWTAKEIPSPNIQITALNGEKEVKFKGKFAAWINQLPAAKALQGSVAALLVADREKSVVSGALDGFSIREVIKKPSSFQVISKDGRTAKGFIDGGEWAIYEVNGNAVSSSDPRAEKLAEDAKAWKADAPTEKPLRSSAEIRKELDALSAKDKAYNRLQNEGGEGYYRDSIPESLHNEYMAALDREFKAKWTKEYFEEVRSAWNSIVAEKSNGGKIALTRKDLESVERRVGEKSQDIAKARTMLGIAPPTPQDAKKALENAKPKIEVRNYNGTNQLWVNGEISHVFGGRSIDEEIAKLDKDNVTLYGKKAEENRRIRGMLKDLLTK